MRIYIASLFVDDQQKALEFYTGPLGFRVVDDMPLGEHRWLTITDDSGSGVMLSLEPTDHPAVPPFRAALVADGIPFTSFAVDDVHSEHARLTGLGVVFTQPPTEMGPVTTAVLDDTCGNLIQLAALPAR